MRHLFHVRSPAQVTAIFPIILFVLTDTQATAATLTVTSTLDNGPGTLRQAMADVGT